MRVLVLNSGSSTLRYKLLDMPQAAIVSSGMEEGLSDHGAGVDRVLKELLQEKIDAVGHRVVHGGELFREPVLITEKVLQGIRSMSVMAPLHNPANALGIERVRLLWPSVPQVAVFDTAFHHTLPPHAFRYAIPDDLYRHHGIRRYGFHGISHAHVARRAAVLLSRPLESLNLITLHLGNGASAAAIRSGRSVDTSMGLTPLEGLVMGTRSGDLDPAVFSVLARVSGKSPDEIEGMLNRECGLQGLGGSNDMRDLERRAGEGDERARLAIDVFAYRVKKYVGAYAAALGRLDAIVFTGGIGENSSLVRARCLQELSILGIALDEPKNRTASSAERAIHAGGSVPVLVIPTNEEVEIALQTVACLEIPLTSLDKPPRSP